MARSAVGLATRILLTILAVVAMAEPAGAQTITGSGVLQARDKLFAKGCGRMRLNGPQTLMLGASGVWAAIDEGGSVLGGTYVSVDGRGRKFDLAFDAQSLGFLRGDLERYLAELCRTLVTVTSIDTRRFRLVLNRAGTRATVRARFRLTGMANGQQGKGSFSVNANGPWTTPP